MTTIPNDDDLGNRPPRCARCQHDLRTDGRPLEIQYSIAAQAWVCLTCHLRAQEAG